MSNDPFQTTEGNPLETLVGEGKKFKTVDDLAKGKLEADTTIELMKAELATLREASNNGKSVAELLAALRPQDDPNPPLRQPEIRTEGTPTYKEEDITQIALKALHKTEEERRLAGNYNASVAKMQEVWGADAGKQLQVTADSLGVSVDYLKQVAQQSTAAFVNITGLNKDRTPPSGTTVPTSTVKFGGDTSKKRDAAFYRELKKTNPSLYKESTTRIQMERDAMLLGEDYFN